MDKSFFAEARKCAERFFEALQFDPNKSDHLESKVVTSYLFGMLTMLGSEMDADGSEIQSSLVASLVHVFGFSERDASHLSSHVIKCTEREHHPAQFTVIERGLEGYMEYYRTGNDQEFPKDITSILEVMREFAAAK
ncbi:Imm48 family immunity protein [Listeria floridensis]|uniref:Imm48 family immunity protein n=1 Tax=Listeria floridensis TaxID=1494962 RepID=UPI00055AF301|nr:Imm48 family immunity protein [Listeria floridensis]